LPTTKPRDRRADLERHTGETLGALIGEQVIHALGEPGDLVRVRVRPLWAGRYRVNVYVGADAASARVADSFFLATDDDGTIVAATPAIARRYPPAAAGAAD
jgi:hypothetical protein